MGVCVCGRGIERDVGGNKDLKKKIRAVERDGEVKTHGHSNKV